jgi:enamine deaminase RidA (YjgF/YER057c/UK114 family)
MSFYEKLKALNIELPVVAAPAAAYVMHARTGNTVFLSGHLAKKDGKVWAGQLGKDVTTEEGKVAARGIAIELIATLQDACGGDLNKVKRIVKVMSLVNSTSTSRNSTWSPTARRNCSSKSSATAASTPAPPSAWRKSRWALASRSN